MPCVFLRQAIERNALLPFPKIVDIAESIVAMGRL